MKTETVPIQSLKPDPANARSHGKRNLDAVVASLTRWGQQKPIVVDKAGIVVAGNATLAAAQALGWTKIKIWRTDLKGAEATAYAIADNRSAELAEWDDDALAQHLAALTNDDAIDELCTGFDEAEIAAMCGGNGEVVEDEVPEVQEDAVTEVGDLWLLGKHRLHCGDATKKIDVDRLLDGAVPFLMVTDPPYGVEYDPTWRRGIRGTFADVKQDGLVANDDRADWSAAWMLSPSVVAYVWHGALHASMVAASLVDARYQIRAQIIWKKQMAPMTRGHYRWQHEPCWYGARGPSKWCGDVNASTIWEIKNLSSVGGGGRELGDEKVGHGTQKPIECMARPIRNHGESGDDVYDPFLGSGTTLIAAEQLGRRCYGLEIEPRYCDVIVRRWQNLTGKRARTESGKELPDG